ncbi:MAG TPA: thiamine pyrophosphate-binding protein [Methylomirabilota bacterium]|nr:thiamine pyrophosphate-binding protein [Methylomirabilota bacterium]
MPARGADVVVEALVAAGVRQLFSLSGNQILSIYDATVGSGIRIIHTRHEAAAVHMADAWGRLTEEPGVALVTAGPGHLNALSALYGALMSESPVVLLSGASPLSQAGRGAFQEMDQAAAAAPVAKASWMASKAERLGEDIAIALDLARNGRPGPVHVSLPGDLLESEVGGSQERLPDIHRPSMPAADADVRRLLELLEASRHPLILTGSAMSRPARARSVERLCAATGIPALAIESPRGVNDPWLHMAATYLGQADFVLLLGKRLDFAVRFGAPAAFSPSCRFVQADWDAEALDSSGRVTLGMVTDPALLAERLAEAFGSLGSGRTNGRWHAWGELVAAARRLVPDEWHALRRKPGSPIHPLRVGAALQPWLDGGAILVADGGEFGQWIQAGCEAGTRLINGPAGSIGSALPMALGARLAHPERTVIAALGDGTFGFHGFELDTALRCGLPAVAVVGNDARWNAEHQLQRQQYGADRAVGCELLPSRYDQLAAALGGHGEYVERAEELEPAIERAVRSGLPACVNVVIEGLAAPTYHRANPAH